MLRLMKFRLTALLAVTSGILNAADQATVSQWLARPIIDAKLPQAEVERFTEDRILRMPKVKTKAEWESYATKMRKDTLDKVLSLSGCVLGTTVCLTMPALSHYFLLARTRKEKACDLFLFICAQLLLVVCTI